MTFERGHGLRRCDCLPRVGKREIFVAGLLFGTPTFECVPAKGPLQMNYAIVLSPVHWDWRKILDVELGRRAITVIGSNRERIELPAIDLTTGRTS